MDEHFSETPAGAVVVVEELERQQERTRAGLTAALLNTEERGPGEAMRERRRLEELLLELNARLAHARARRMKLGRIDNLHRWLDPNECIAAGVTVDEPRRRELLAELAAQRIALDALDASERRRRARARITGDAPSTETALELLEEAGRRRRSGLTVAGLAEWAEATVRRPDAPRADSIGRAGDADTIRRDFYERTDSELAELAEPLRGRSRLVKIAAMLELEHRQQLAAAILTTIGPGRGACPACAAQNEPGPWPDHLPGCPDAPEQPDELETLAHRDLVTRARLAETLEELEPLRAELADRMNNARSILSVTTSQATADLARSQLAELDSAHAHTTARRRELIAEEEAR